MTSVGSWLYLAACLTAVCCGAENMNLASHCLHVDVRNATFQRQEWPRVDASEHVTSGIEFSWVINSISHIVLPRTSCLQTAVPIASRTANICLRLSSLKPSLIDKIYVGIQIHKGKFICVFFLRNFCKSREAKSHNWPSLVKSLTQSMRGFTAGKINKMEWRHTVRIRPAYGETYKRYRWLKRTMTLNDPLLI